MILVELELQLDPLRAQLETDDALELHDVIFALGFVSPTRADCGFVSHAEFGDDAGEGIGIVQNFQRSGDVGDGQLGSWGFPEGGMGGVSRASRLSTA